MLSELRNEGSVAVQKKKKKKIRGKDRNSKIYLR